MPAPCRVLATSVRAQKCGMVMSVTTQIIFPYMSDARAPAMDVHMTPQDAGMARSFWLILSALLIGVNGYSEICERRLLLRRDPALSGLIALYPRLCGRMALGSPAR